MADLIQPFIDELARNRGSALDEPLVAIVNDAIAALQQIQAAIAGGGPFLPLAGGTMAGPIALPNASAAAPALAFQHGGFFDDTANLGVGFSNLGAQTGWLSSGGITVQKMGGGGANITVQSEGTSTLITIRNSNDPNGSQQSARKARGTIAAPLVVQNLDILAQSVFSGWDGVSAFQIAASYQVRTIEPTPSPTAMAGRYIFNASPLGSIAATEVARIDFNTGLSMYGANPVIDSNRLLRNRVFTVATLPTFVEGAQASVSDATLTMITGLGLAPVGGGTNHVPVTADNVGWKIV
jgi:hypothetical protein